MNKFAYTEDNRKIIEKFQLLVYSLYAANIALALFKQQNGPWHSLVVLVLLFASWLVYVGQYWSYRVRAGLTSIMMQITVVLYAVHVDDIYHVLPVFMLFIVLLQLYGFQDLVSWSAVGIVFIFGYHLFVKKSISVATSQDIIEVVFHFFTVFFLQYVAYVWTKRNSEGSSHLLKAIDELEELERSKDDFLANVSHEIRTPLNTICGMSELVLREPLPYKTKESLMSIQVAGRNLMAIVSDILDYSELQTGKIEMEEEAYSITSTINDVVNMTLARKNEKNIELIVDCDANIPCALLGDEKKLRRVIIKLVDNAIKFTEQGFVCISVGYRRESYGINLIVSVNDTGIGMDEKSLEKLFTRFSQVETGRNRQAGGIGLGLAISNVLVHKMGGAITVKSRLGKGTTVQIAVPQRVLDETPMATIQNKEKLNVATFFDMEQFDVVEIRDEYSKMLLHIVEQLKMKCHICRNSAELQRLTDREALTHVFTSAQEYLESREYFDKLAFRTKVVIVLERFEEKDITNPRLLKIYKPFHILTIASILNAPDALLNDRIDAVEKFEARDAHVLVVDDNRMNIRVIEGLLANYKIKVTTALSGQEALEKITKAQYDFVFMDHMMPEMDGVETLNQIRHKVGTYYQKVPIIALTANAVAGTREQFLEAGFSDFLEKPVERSVLERVLKRHLPPDKIMDKKKHQETSQPQTVTALAQESVSEESALCNEVPNQNRLEEEFGSMGLNARQGILYCNGVEGYLKVLQGYCDDSDALGQTAEDCYQKEDWKNYTIAVHGIKGAMRSIGAAVVADCAQKLEYAGKEGHIDYIRDNHDKLMHEYQQLFLKLKENDWIKCGRQETDEEAGEEDAPCSVLEAVVFDKILEDMEAAMYVWDGAKLAEIVAELQRHTYLDQSLKEMLAPVKKKIEMSDYVSAVELTKHLKSRLDSKER